MPSGDSCLSRAAQCHVEQQHRAYRAHTKSARSSSSSAGSGPVFEPPRCRSPSHRVVHATSSTAAAHAAAPLGRLRSVLRDDECRFARCGV